MTIHMSVPHSFAYYILINIFYYQIKLMSSPLCFFKIMSLFVVNFTVMLDQASGLQPAYIFFSGPVPSQVSMLLFSCTFRRLFSKNVSPFTHTPLAGASLKAFYQVLEGFTSQDQTQHLKYFWLNFRMSSEV